MLPEHPRAGSPEEWLRYARSDLEIACVTPTERIMLEGLCFHAQQVVEKALKALLIAYEIQFPRTHNIRRLLDLLPDELDIPENVQDSASLTDYAVVARYPGDLEPVNHDEYHEAVHLAETVLVWTEEALLNVRPQAQETDQEPEETTPDESENA